jgi:hypothetical protein
MWAHFNTSLASQEPGRKLSRGTVRDVFEAIDFGPHQFDVAFGLVPGKHVALQQELVVRRPRGRPGGQPQNPRITSAASVTDPLSWESSNGLLLLSDRS